ncbi:hypothetical protein TC41_2870 [Alicyclobacillus acidocaldarius subsp. acidocaldarius Tc-4-1]|uniref:Uncharacterized protein n=1 Tax=Alicyclobacillus acidocaldarius (strain Tc-4-1) TaxID=1048834 RepID=F8IK55_ALIAT|nr:hypothetical protein TC41_2870 [Alicyclobacillus acidocaldarius subsp. acidocaldarius Tc-4-1]
MMVANWMGRGGGTVKARLVRVVHLVIASVMLACTAISLVAIALELAVRRLLA